MSGVLDSGPFGDFGVQVGEGNRIVGEEPKRPRGVQGPLDDGPGLDRGRRGEPVAVVALAVADGPAVDIDQQRLVAGVRDPVQDRLQSHLVRRRVRC